MPKAGDLRVGDCVDLVMTVPARVRKVVRRPDGSLWVGYDRMDELGHTFIVPYAHESVPAEDAQDRPRA